MCLGLGVAQASGPTVRFGLTGAIEDQAAPNELELGPMIGVGWRLGPLVADVDYAYLSFMDTETGAGGMQRVGVNLRGDLFRATRRYCVIGFGCVGGYALYAEAGVAERFGQWHLDSVERSPANGDRATEEHIGAGIELDNTAHPRRYGWQLGVRLAVTPHDPFQIDASCRGSCMTGTGSPSMKGGQDTAFLVEWTFLLGR